MRSLPMLTLLFFTLPGCVLDLEGAPCEEDSNCPSPQWCQSDGTCTEHLPDVAEACENVVRVGARKTVSCYSGSLDAWLQQIPGEQLCAAVGNSVTTGTLTFDPTRIRQCKAAILERTCGDVTVPSILTGCEMFQPTAALGEGCGTPYDCAQGWCKVGGACPGTCTAFVADDAACTTADKCNRGASCVEGFCRRHRQEGEECSNSLPCDPFLAYCDGNPGVCQLRRTSGGCSFSECVPSYRCTPPIFGGSCSVAIPVGGACTPGRYQCEALAHCSDVTNQCEALSGSGDGCGLNFEGEIAGCLGARCAGSTCANYVAAGQSCNNDGECGQLAHCDTVCVPEFCGP